MTDEELLRCDRTVIACEAAPYGGGFDATLSCGHAVTFVIEPAAGTRLPCSQCLEIVLHRHKGRLWE